jgi:hypothetical protein
MIINRKHLPRRTFLKGLGTVVALPFLDAMVPAFAGPSFTKYPVRLAFPYVPNGMMMQYWTPQKVGKDFEFTRILKALEPFRQDMLVLTGLNHANGAGPGDHAGASATYLTGVAPNGSSPADIRLGISVDQVAAQAIGSQTRLPSIELGCESTREVGACDGGYSCAYINNMSWRNATTPVPLETNPRLVFERLYGSLDTSTDPKLQARLDANRKSVLDYVSDETKRLEGSLGASDKLKLEEYLGAVRDIEKQIERAEDRNRQSHPQIEKPVSVPAVFGEHARLMSDLLVLAFQADITRVATLVYAKEGSGRAYPELGFGDGHHPVTHHRNRPDLIEKCALIELHHMEQFGYLAGKMKSIQEGDGTLLDHSMVVYGSSMSEPNGHNHKNVPCLLLGRGDGSIKPGRHIVYSSDTPQTNLWLTLLDRIGVRTETLGDSTGKVEHLTDI